MPDDSPYPLKTFRTSHLCQENNESKNYEFPQNDSDLDFKSFHLRIKCSLGGGVFLDDGFIGCADITCVVFKQDCYEVLCLKKIFLLFDGFSDGASLCRDDFVEGKVGRIRNID